MNASRLGEARLQQSLYEAAGVLNLEVEAPFALELPCGRITAPALVKNFGYECGILIVTTPDSLGSLADRLPEFGYGYATVSSKQDFTVESWLRLCRRWGWTGAGKPPAWYNGQVHDG